MDILVEVRGKIYEIDMYAEYRQRLEDFLSREKKVHFTSNSSHLKSSLKRIRIQYHVSNLLSSQKTTAQLGVKSLFMDQYFFEKFTPTKSSINSCSSYSAFHLRFPQSVTAQSRRNFAKTMSRRALSSSLLYSLLTLYCTPQLCLLTFFTAGGSICSHRQTVYMLRSWSTQGLAQ